LGPTLLAIVEVVRRYGFGTSFPWQQDAVTYGILSGVFLFFGITQSRGMHLRVTVFLGLLRGSGGRTGHAVASILEFVGAAIGLVFCAYLVLRGIPVAERMVLLNRMTDSQVLPLWPFFMAFLVGMALMAVSFFFQLYVQIQTLRGRGLGLQPFGDADGGEPIL
jgi:TRAP-type C4-dicarboxylate transport system permease small subunit